MLNRTLAIAILGASLVGAGCDDGWETAPLRMEVRAANGAGCDPTGSLPDAFTDIKKLQVVVRGIHPKDINTDDQQVKVLYNKTFNLSGNDSLRVGGIPEGTGHTLELFGTGGSVTWYARDPNVDVKRNAENPVELLLVPHGTAAPVAVPTAFSNTWFPAAVALADGRVMISGGFRDILQDGAELKLAQPSAAWFIFDPKIGEVTAHGEMPEPDGAGARGAHAMVFLQQTDQVLVVGGASELLVDDSGGFPIYYDGARNSITQSYLFTPPPPGTTETGSWAPVDPKHRLALSRVFPRVMTMADGTIAVSGGGEWPLDGLSEYKRVEVFDPEPDSDQGGVCQATLSKDSPCFLRVSSFDSFYPRAGHTLAFVKEQSKLNYYLVWGGTPDCGSVDCRRDQMAELMRQSGRQRDEVDGNFQEVTVLGADFGATYFHEMTPLSAQRFLVTGGARYEDDGHLAAPQDDEAYVLQYADATSGDGSVTNPTITVTKIAGGASLFPARVFHSAHTADNMNVTVVGGFTGIDARDNSKVMFLESELTDAETGTFAYQWLEAPENATFPMLGGHAGLTMGSGSILVVGGEADLRTKGEARCGRVEIYTPSIIKQP